MLHLSGGDCEEFLAALREMGSSSVSSSIQLNANATAFKFRSPQVTNLTLRVGEKDALLKVERGLEWTLEPDTVGELAKKIERAIAQGHFIPAELGIVEGPRGVWFRIYAELDETSTSE